MSWMGRFLKYLRTPGSKPIFSAPSRRYCLPHELIEAHILPLLPFTRSASLFRKTSYQDEATNPPCGFDCWTLAAPWRLRRENERRRAPKGLLTGCHERRRRDAKPRRSRETSLSILEQEYYESVTTAQTVWRHSRKLTIEQSTSSRNSRTFP